MKSNQVMKGALLCLITSILWGIMFPVMGSALQHLDAFTLTIIRYVSVSVCLGLLLLIIEGKKAFSFEGKGVALWFYGTMAIACYNFLVFWAQHQLTSSGTILASIMESMMPMMSITLLWVLRNERPNKLTLTYILIALIGVILIITKGDFSSFLLSGDSLFPTIVMFIGVMGWVIFSLGVEQFGNWSALRYSALSSLLGTASSLVIVILTTAFGYTEIPSIQAVYTIRWELSFTVLIAGVGSMLSWNAGIKLLKPINAMLFLNFVPVVTFIITVLQGYAMTPYDLIGSCFIIGALVLNNLVQRKQKEYTVL